MNTTSAQIKRQTGGVVIEFAIVMVLLLSMAAGIFSFGRAFWYADALTKATRDGARLIATWPKATLSSAGVVAAKSLAARSANAANISPQLDPLASTGVYVKVACLKSDFTPDVCTDGVAPSNVSVSINGFSVQLAEWFPFVDTSGVNNTTTINLSPHTTMRYMN